MSNCEDILQESYMIVQGKNNDIIIYINVCKNLKPSKMLKLRGMDNVKKCMDIIYYIICIYFFSDYI